MNGGSKTEIKASQIAAHLRTADAYVTKVDWAAKKAAPAPGNLYRERLLASAATTPSASVVESLKNVRKDGSVILDVSEHRVLHDVRVCQDPVAVDDGAAAGHLGGRLLGPWTSRVGPPDGREDLDDTILRIPGRRRSGSRGGRRVGRRAVGENGHRGSE